MLTQIGILVNDMNKEWSELNKTMQAQIKNKDTYIYGIGTLFELRNMLMQTIISFRNDISREDFNVIPFINADGYHSKTIAYSLWHIFRIEDIVAHTLINCDEQIFFSGNYKERINSPIITTGNELVKNEISDFSKQLDINELYSYIFEVKENTEEILRGLPYQMLKLRISAETYIPPKHLATQQVKCKHSFPQSREVQNAGGVFRVK